jgi:hypothetical protein
MPRIPLAGLLLLSLATPAAGQTLRDRLGELFTFGSCGKTLCLDGSVTAANGHGAHFLPDLIAGNASLIGFLTEAIGASIASTPVAASGGGVQYRMVGGLPVRTSESSGPILAERAQTLGQGRLFFGANMTGSSFQSIRGTPLDRIVLNFTHQDVGTPGLGDPVLENDIMEVRLDLQASVLVTAAYATYGISDRVDIGVAVPLVHSSIQGRSEAQIFPFGSTAVHFFTGTLSDPGLRATEATFGSATGIGDVAVRIKANLRDDQDFAIAVLGDARLPTGNAEDFLGSGYLSLRAMGIASARFGEFRPHLNLGYLLRADGHSDAILATVGFEQPLAPWATLLADVVSEFAVGAGGLQTPETIVYQFPFVRTVEPTNIRDRPDHAIGGAMGFKFRTNHGPTFITNVLMPLYQGGVTASAVWTAGLEFNF